MPAARPAKRRRLRSLFWPPARVRIRRLAQENKRLRQDLAKLRGDVTRLRKETNKTQQRLAKLESSSVLQMEPAMELMLRRRGGRFMDRAIDDELLTRLVREVRHITGAERADHHVSTAFATLMELEARGLGRMAGSTQNVVGKLTATTLFDVPNDDVLEIGTLFGLFAAGLHRQFARRGRWVTTTIVDPLEGVQLQGGRSLRRDRTGVPVVEQTLHTNQALAGVPTDRYRVLVGYSQDAEVRAGVGDREYGTIIVDGDHSAEGVASDMAWIEQLAAEGAIVVLDDYGDSKWPGVQEAVDAHLKGLTRFTMLGTVATSAYLRAGAPVNAAAENLEHDWAADLPGITGGPSSSGRAAADPTVPGEAATPSSDATS